MRGSAACSQLGLYKGSGKRDSKSGSLYSKAQGSPWAVISGFQPQNNPRENRNHLESGAVGQNVRQQWYAVRVRSEHEDVVARHLRVRGLETFLPLYRRQHRDSDRFREVELPLFPGYVLCQFDPANRLPVLTVPGVVHLVGAGNRPLPIDETEVAAMQAATRSGLPMQPWPFSRDRTEGEN